MRLRYVVVGSLIMSLALGGAFSITYFFFGSEQVAKAATITYYADDCAPYGSGSGTLGDPYCGIQTAVDEIPANLGGDSYVIRLLSGTYNEGVQIVSKNTSATETITIQPHTGANVIVDGNSLTNTWGFLVSATPYVIIEGLTIRDFYWDGIKCEIGSDNAIFRNNTIYDISSNAVAGIWLGNGLGSGNGCINVIIENNTIYDLASGAAIHIGDDSAYAIISGNTVSTGVNNGIFISNDATDALITENIVYGFPGAGIYLGTGAPLDADITFNRVYSNGMGIASVGSAVNGTTLVDHNLVYDNILGIALQQTGSVTITYNTVYGNTCLGALAMAPSGELALVKNNIFSNNALVNDACSVINPGLSDLGYGGLAIPDATVSYVTANYNVFHQNGQNMGADDHVVSLNIGTFARVSVYSTEAEINDDVEIDITETSLTGNVVGDPAFADPDGTDNILGYDLGTNYGADDDFREGSYGAAVDAADPGDSFSNEPSPNGGRANAGFYGNTAYAANTPLDGETEITATIDPYISFNLNTNICSLGGGTLAIGAISTCYYTATVGTNAVNGYIASIEGDADLTSGLDTIPATDGTITNGSSEYGIATSKSSVDVAQFSGTCDDPMTSPMTATAVSGTKQSISESSGPVADDETVICHAAAVNVLTAAGTYTGLVTVSVLPNF